LKTVLQSLVKTHGLREDPETTHAPKIHAQESRGGNRIHYLINHIFLRFIYIYIAEIAEEDRMVETYKENSAKSYKLVALSFSIYIYI